MVTSHTVLKDFLLTIAIIGIFCCLSLVAQAYHLTIQIESEAYLEAEDIKPAELVVNNESVEVLPTFLPVKEIKIEPKSSVNLITEIKPEPELEPEPKPAVVTVVKEETPAVIEEVAEVKPVVVTKSVPTDTTDFASELISLIEKETNSFRLAKGLAPLHREPVLAENAKRYSQTILEGNFLSHTDEQGCNLTCRFKADSYEASSWGENLATIKFDKNLSAKEIADQFMSGWKKSSGHRENLLSSDFTHQGVGVARSNNVVYVSVQFAKQ